MTPSPNPAPEPAPEKSATPRFVYDPDSGYIFDQQKDEWIEDEYEPTDALNALNADLAQARLQMEQTVNELDETRTLLEQDLAQARAELEKSRADVKALREALEKADKLIDSLWDSVPWGQTHNLDIAALNTVPGLIKQALASTQEDAP